MIKYLKGFYDIENDDIRDFRWMQKSAEIEVTEYDFNRDNYFLKFDIAADKETKLIISADKLFEINLVSGWQTKFVPLDKICNIENKKIKFKSDNCLSVADDNRELSLMISNINIIKKEDAPKIILQEGFYSQENDGIRDFYWMQKKAKLIINNFDIDDCLIIEVGISNELPIELDVGSKVVTLINGWQQLCFNLKDIIIQDDMIEISTKYEVINRDEKRQLSLMISNIEVRKGNEFEKNSQLLAEEVLKKELVNSYPTFITYETSARCNLKCAMCAVDESLNEFEKCREAGVEKTKETYITVLPYASKLQLHASGECLLGKDFWTSLDEAGMFAKKHSMEIEIFTNGLLLNKENRKRIIESALTDIVISVDAATEITYKKIRGGNFNLLLNNIENLVKENKIANNKKLRIVMAFVMMRENIEELPAFVKLAHSLGVEIISFWPLFSTGVDMPIKKKEDFIFYYKQQMLNFYPKLMKEMVDKSYKIASKLGIRVGITPCFEKEYTLTTENDFEYPLSIDEFDKKIKYNTKNIDRKKKINLYKYCYLPWNTAFITTEGNFAPCLLLMYLGGIDNVLGKDFKDVWNSKIMKELRKSIIEGKVHPICKGASCIFAEDE